LTAGTFHLDRLTGYIIVLCGTAPIIAFSFLFYRLLERPFMRSKPRA
jgi:peptidoglycan/LPS O-acetylase OafA/YrhL